MDQRELGNTGLKVSPIGFGAFKIGRNVGAKYPQGYNLPDDQAVDHLLNGVLDLGINYIDTAPAYGLSEQHIGRAIAHRRHTFVLSTKVGETFEDGASSYDFSKEATRQSVEQSLRRLNTDMLDIVYVHSNRDELQVIHHTDVIPTLIEMKERGLIRALGFSGYTAEGAAACLNWADVLMLTYHQNDTTMSHAMAMATDAGIGVVVKNPLASGHLPAADALRFVFNHSSVDTAVVGSLNLDHLKTNLAAAWAG